jgi:D-xylonolactonase
MDRELDRVADTRCDVGEGPLWHDDEQRLYWADIARGEVFRYDPATDDHEQVHDCAAFGGYTIQADGSLLLFMSGGRIAVWREGMAEEETVVEGIPAESDGRFNDVVADPEGRVFAGTVTTDDHPGRLYRVDTDGGYEVVEDGLDLPNGLGFTPDRSRLYLTDTGYFTDQHDGRIYRYDYDRATGELSNRETFVDAGEEEGLPDGMTVDAEGAVWSAFWDGGRLVRYDPDDGREIDRVEVPARKVASATFGGEGYGDLYVTTAGGEDRASEGPGAGALFRLSPEVPGRAPFRSRVER